MSTVKNNPAQEVVNVLGTSGPMTGQELKAASGLEQTVLAAAVQGLIQQGIVTRDGANNFDVVPDYRVEGRDSQGELTTELFAETQAAAQTPVAPSRPAPAKGAANKGGAKKAATQTPAKAASKGVTVPSAQQETAEPKTQYYSLAMDQLTIPELEERVRVGMSAAEANFAMANTDNQIVAEILERWCIRANRRIKGLQKGKMEVRAR